MLIADRMPTMLSLFTMPKAFTGVFDLVQRNAILSWTKLRPHCEILLCGDDQGTVEMAAEIGAKHVPGIPRNSRGTPLVSGLFEEAHRAADNQVMGYVNADIILMSDFMEAVQSVTAARSRFLLVGQRRDIALSEAISFDADWERRYRQLGISTGRYYPGIDYFVYPKGLWGDIPPFALGRYYWDNWFPYAARLRKAPVIDATQMVLALHQEHPIGADLAESAEARENAALLGPGYNRFTTFEATHQLTRIGILPRCRSCYPVCACKPE
jgi:hypothetical protein